MINPRSSQDPEIKAALRVWDNASPYRDTAFGDAMQMRTALQHTPSHQAFGWAALTCGRIAAHRQQVELAEEMLTEALGRLFFVGDKYGEALAIAHLAIPHVLRQNLDRALELALKPLSMDIPYVMEDRLLLHNIASQCHWAKGEAHPAIMHLIKAHDLLKDTSDLDRRSAVLGNLGNVLDLLGEWDLALAASTEAWRLQLSQRKKPQELQLVHLSNMVHLHCQREDHEAASRDAETLFEYLKAGNHATTWLMFASIADAFSLGGQTEKAQYCLDRANVLLEPTRTPHSNATKLLCDAHLLQASKNHDAAIAIAKEVLDHPTATVMMATHRQAASLLSRSYTALGRKSEASKWHRVANELGREKLLGDILTRQFRTSIATDQPLEPLTEKELTCLSLSAHGQTSADIALKLGLKTRTVNFHFAKILRKLNAMNRQEAIAKASEANLLRRPR